MKLSIAVFFGGKSTEHEVSIISALQAMENINLDKYNLVPIYITKSGDFYSSKGTILTDIKNFSNVKLLLSKCENVYFVKDGSKTYVRSVNKKVFGNSINQVIDVAFPIVHGTNVEDGNLQGFLKTLNIPLVGPDVLAASLSMDKFVLKEYAKALNIPVIEAKRIDAKEFKNIDKNIELIENEIKYPMIVKPVNLGSSIGIKKARDRRELMDALELAFSFAKVVLIERAIENIKEINCAVLGDKFEAITSALEEPIGNDEILSFEDKYMSGSKGAKVKGSKISAKGSKSGMASLKRKVPADISEDVANRIREYALKIFKYIGCSGVSRIDFIIDRDDMAVYLNEINSIPGSLAFYLFEPIGIKYKDLIDKLITIAINNYKSDERISYTFDNNLLT